MLTERLSSAVVVNDDCARAAEKNRKRRTSEHKEETKRDIQVLNDLQKKFSPEEAAACDCAQEFRARS